ncbi:unnamed protein product [Calicophoron daubneyi]|uniref:Uncharacterized protein n=1 Tax=Calicophoron daubneyi TaxID=300641 RepID=A0AAV2TWP7_CALDB
MFKLFAVLLLLYTSLSVRSVYSLNLRTRGCIEDHGIIRCPVPNYTNQAKRQIDQSFFSGYGKRSYPSRFGFAYPEYEYPLDD